MPPQALRIELHAAKRLRKDHDILVAYGQRSARLRSAGLALTTRAHNSKANKARAIDLGKTAGKRVRCARATVRQVSCPP